MGWLSMADREHLPVYPYDRAEAGRLEQTEQWRESLKLNIACKDAIEQAIRRGFDGMCLESDCVNSVIAEYGYHRTAYVLANSLQQKDYDGRFSRGNLDWAKQIFIAPDRKGAYRYKFAVDSHPAVLDGFVNQYRRAYQALGMFDRTHCLPDTNKQDFVGKVIVLSPDFLKESCFTPQDQLWLCTGGFGSHANARGRAVFATNLGDGEHTRLNREDFVGVLADSFIPDWARERLQQLRNEQNQSGPEMGMTIK